MDPIRLKPLGIKGLPGIVEVPVSGLSIGRDASNGLVLSGEDHPYISSFHARLGWQDGECYVEDLESKNGTLINGQSIARQTLAPGDVIQFGREVGVRFAVVGADASATQTLDLGHAIDRMRPGADLGATTILRLKHVLGIPDEAARAAGKKRWAPSVGTFVLFAIVIGVVARGFWAMQQEDLARDRLADEQRKTFESFRAAQAELAHQYEKERTEILAERDRLQGQIDTLNAGDEDAAEELETLRGQLAETNDKLEQFEPIDLEAIKRSKREVLERVLKSIVYIENRIVLKEVGGERYLHNTAVDGKLLRTRESNDDLYVDNAGSGSGFVISAEGYIATNAHVVSTPDSGEELRFEDVMVERVALLEVVFTGTSTHRPATLVAIASEGSEDFAVLEIEPFEGMPFLDGFTTDTPIPTEGMPVRLFGFPLGTRLIQDRDVLTASVFLGSVSRRKASAFIQVQSAVYPGNSGGPVIDEAGHVIGIVTAVQTVPGGQIASDIGFVLPIRNLEVIWPLRPDRVTPPGPLPL